MKQFALTLPFLVPALTSALVMGGVAGTVLAQAEAQTEAQPEAHTDQPTIDSIRDLWTSQYKALDAHDVDGVLATYAEGDDIMLMGTGPGEHWVGKDEVKDAYTHFMEQFDPNTMQADCGEGASSSQGGVLWLTAVCSFSDQQGEKAREFVANLSAVLVNQADGWRFHTMHFSHLTGADPAEQAVEQPAE
jgi:uncharacterized protein (TIGR02246 family)